MTVDWDQIKSWIADLARPFSIYAASGSGAYATFVIAQKVTTAEGGALVLGVLAGWGTALYAGKVYETQKLGGQNAEIEKIRAQANPPPAQALAPASAVVDDGELPLDQRVKL